MTIEDKAESLGFKEGSATVRCICGHVENVHVPFSTVGDLGWYGCVQCDKEQGLPCKFFIRDNVQVQGVL